ncbi:MAG: zinc ribbon domain-containing protein [Lachnospiraceae bacterium]|nr:zinc ribbon domain-containing protein [Lachnospiraceae bacterium]
MFFFAIMGINDEIKQLPFHKNTVCNNCGRYGSLDGFMTCSVFSVFFIPIIRFSKKYYLKASCCGTVFEVDKKKGRKMEYGEQVDFNDSELKASYSYHNSSYCPACGYPISYGHNYCPRCGRKA